MTVRSKHGFFALLAATLATAGCGGGGGGGGGAVNPPPSGGIEGTGLAVGAITGFGSVIVNGVRFDTSDALITVDGAAATEDDLAVAQVVTLKGTINDDGVTGSADTVEFDNEVEGPIDSVAVTGDSFVVLGQTVITDADTVFDDSIILPLGVGEVVEVSGFRQSSGAILATRIEGRAAVGELEAKGIVANLDGAAFTFELGSLVVNYASAVLADFPGGMISENDPVEVKGNDFDGNGALLATRVEYEGEGLGAEDGDEAEVEGLITRFGDATDFDVGGQPVVTDGGTRFEGGGPGDLGLDVRVEVEGVVNAQAVLLTDKVEIKSASSVRIEALVETVNAADGTLTVLGGLLVRTNALGTQFEDDSDVRLEPFAIGDINPMDFLEIRGSEDPAGSDEVAASRVERDDAEDESSLQGLVDAVTRPQIVILGVTVDTSNAEFQDSNETPLTADQFFGRLDAGDLVKADGVWNGAVLIADEVEFEADN